MIRPNPRVLGIIAAGSLGIAGVAVNHFEGNRVVAYLDPVGVPTVCAGVTQGVNLGDSYTAAECSEKTKQALLQHLVGIEQCIHGYLTPTQWAAVTSWAYNIGVAAACSSTLVRLINDGAPATEWCEQLPRWVYAHGRKLPGLVSRRASEREMCLSTTYADKGDKKDG